MAYTVKGGLDVLAVDAPDDLPELRQTTLEQRDTTQAARARGEDKRQAKRAKEDRIRMGGPPPAFMPRGSRPLPPEGVAGEGLGAGEAEPGAGGGFPPPRSGVILPPAFGEYQPGDPRTQGVDDADDSGVQEHLMEGPLIGPQVGQRAARSVPLEILEAPAGQAATLELHGHFNSASALRLKGGAVGSGSEGEVRSPAPRRSQTGRRPPHCPQGVQQRVAGLCCGIRGGRSSQGQDGRRGRKQLSRRCSTAHFHRRTCCGIRGGRSSQRQVGRRGRGLGGFWRNSGT